MLLAIVLRVSLRDGEEDRPMHVLERSRLAGPDFKLPYPLVNEHSVPGDYMNIFRARHLYQSGFEW